MEPMLPLSTHGWCAKMFQSRTDSESGMGWLPIVLGTPRRWCESMRPSWAKPVRWIAESADEWEADS